MLLSVVLVYFGVALFIYLTLRNKKPVKWSQIFDAISLKSNSNDDVFNIPGPLRLPFIGSTWVHWFNPPNKLHEYYRKLNQDFGDVVLESFGNINAVSLYKRQDIEKMLRYPSKYPFRPPTEIMSVYRLSRPDRYSSVGLTNANGQLWSLLRSKMTSKTFENKKVLSRLFPAQNAICDDFVARIKSSRNSENIVESVNDIARSFAFESSSSFIVGQRIDSFGASLSHRLTGASKEYFNIFSESYYGNQMWKYFPTELYKRYAKAEESAFETVQEIIAHFSKDGLKDDGSPLMTILAAKGLDEKEKITGVVDFFVAGIDIILAAILIFLNYTSKDLESQQRIYEETKHFSDEFSFDDVASANYTRAVITECFRLCPSAFAVARFTEEDMDFSGYRVKAGTLVLNQTSAACRKEENFVNAQEFLPQRWINEEGQFDANLPVGASICVPFGTGKRMCPGKKFAEHLMMFTLIKLVRAFEIKFVGEPEIVFEFIQKVKCPVDIQFCDRIESKCPSSH